MRPDTAIFHQHVNDADFQVGVDNGMWSICNENSNYPTWPIVIIWVKAAEKKDCPDKYHFRFDLSGYPSVAPAACPWNNTTNARLENNQWPRGRKFVNNTFNYGWNPNALYAPCDRIAMAGHDTWRTQFPDLWWQPSFKITVYLNFLFRLLNSSDYAKC
jgi:hypothetical protein